MMNKNSDRFKTLTIFWEGVVSVTPRSDFTMLRKKCRNYLFGKVAKKRTLPIMWQHNSGF